ncbi:uncharacterized protein A1O5_11011, partial [Cladophialophora psammophila CBS 110553]
KGVCEALEEHGVDATSIKAIIWSHWHWDHVGDPSTFGMSTALIVGPGLKSMSIPGYPTNLGAPVDSDFAGREVRALDFNGGGNVKGGNFDAIDYF